MGLLFKTYNGKHQLHFYREVWVVKNKAQLDEVLGMFSKKEAAKVKVTPGEDSIELELNEVILDCKDISDLKVKFGQMVDLKVKYQKVTPPVAPVKGKKKN